MIIFFSCTPAISLEQKEILDMKFVRLEAGIFQMGGAPPIAHPKHSVSLTKPFWISDIEVTQQTYSLLMNENPSLEKDPKKPVSGLLWTEAMAFCNTLSVQEKRTPCYTHISNSGALWSLDCDGFRLPMEDEWEYAAKSGTDWEYAGHPEPKAVGWFRENGQEAHIPRQKKPNAWGLYDMSGNVSEWVWDGYHPYTEEDRIASISRFSTPNRISRGGAWNDFSIDAPVSIRSVDGDEWRFPWIGFRIVQSAVQSTP